jgi:hypothetical protein
VNLLHVLRLRKDTPMPTTEQPATVADDVVMRFLTQGGAIVQVTEEHRTTWWNKADPTGKETVYPFQCLGCGYDFDNYTSVITARAEANQHATECRAMPRPGGAA